MAARMQHSNAFQAWTYALAGLLALTNAGWFLSSRITANDHAAALKAAQAAAHVQERIVYEYRDSPGAMDRHPAPGIQRRLQPNERCMPSDEPRRGYVFSKDGNAWSATGERCDPTLV